MPRRDHTGKYRSQKTGNTSSSSGTGSSGSPSSYANPLFHFGSIINDLGEYTSNGNPEGRVSSDWGVIPADAPATYWRWRSNLPTNALSKAYKIMHYER
jgi:hypothetical protein